MKFRAAPESAAAFSISSRAPGDPGMTSNRQRESDVLALAKGSEARNIVVLQRGVGNADQLIAAASDARSRLTFRRIWRLRIGGDGEHIDLLLTEHALRDASEQEMLSTILPVRPHDDEIGLLPSSEL